MLLVFLRKREVGLLRLGFSLGSSHLPIPDRAFSRRDLGFSLGPGPVGRVPPAPPLSGVLTPAPLRRGEEEEPEELDEEPPEVLVVPLLDPLLDPLLVVVVFLVGHVLRSPSLGLLLCAPWPFLQLRRDPVG